MDQMNQEASESVQTLLRPRGQSALLPPDAPLQMPVQPVGVRGGTFTRDRMTISRAILLLLSGTATSLFAYFLYGVLSVVHMTLLQAVFLVLCTLCFAWVALGSASAVLGFATALFFPRPRNAVPASPLRANDRTALLFPIYQEDTARIAATIEAIAHELDALGVADRFDVFVLSDSRSPDVKARELRAVRLLLRRLSSGMNLYYRVRAENTDKKSGNIADWVSRFGAAYETFIILDADSIMSGALLLELQGAMATNPRAGMIQTVPRPVGAQTLFARLQQFAVAFYGPVVSSGFACWYQESGNYWGHNAIVRTRAFASAAGLPRLSGPPPLGGHIQSHDFVEAAFLRRAGWEVRMLPGLQGSYEACPPTLIDVAVRDRRWAQGNLQHVRILAAKGLPWMSRLHLAMGSYAYLASVLWMLSLMVGVVLSLQSAYTLPVYFPDKRTLFPLWPVIDPTKALYLFTETIGVLLLPKILGLTLAILRPLHASPMPCGQRILAGACVEIVLSVLMAPIFMLTQTTAVAQILAGKDSGWSAQRRDGAGPEFRRILRFHSWHVGVGIALAAACAMASVYVLAWMSPIIMGLVLSPTISLLTSRPGDGQMSKLLATPEEVDPPPIVAAVAHGQLAWTALLEKRAAQNLRSCALASRGP
jgi:membrane glycosyltransferase